MKKRYLRHLRILHVCSLVLLLSSCSGSSGELMKFVAEMDSLRSVNDSLATRLDTYDEAIDVLYSTLDSIAIQESLIFKSNGEVPLTKDAVRYNLERYELLLKKQENKIQQLESKLKKNRDTTNLSLRVVNQLRTEIKEKNIKIEELRAELDNEKMTVNNLQLLVSSHEQTISSLKTNLAQLNKIIIHQDNELNAGYVLTASAKEMKQKGIVVKRGKARLDAIDRKHFSRIDIRKCTEFTFQAKHPRILTDVPSSTYELTTTGDGHFTLTVLDVPKFWEVYNYLIIQTD